MNKNDKTISYYIKECHENSISKGFYENQKRNIAEMLMLITSELSEALEADRINKHALWSKYEMLMNHHSFTKDMGNEEPFRIAIKDTFEDEIADAFIRLFDLCGYLKIDIEKHIQAKMEYNKTRPYKHDKEY